MRHRPLKRSEPRFNIGVEINGIVVVRKIDKINTMYLLYEGLMERHWRVQEGLETFLLDQLLRDDNDKR